LEENITTKGQVDMKWNKKMKWDKTADVVVVGLGAAGSCTAIEAHDNGAKVLVLEADKVAGGNTRLSGGTLRIFKDTDKVYQRATSGSRRNATQSSW
jgi:glycine/D-amino acid oxidase-like deaminating enzyme